MKRRFQLLPGVLQVSLKHGKAPQEIVPVLADAARLALAEHLHDLVVVSGYHDPATPEAVSEALEQIHALGAAQLRMAFVAFTLPQYSVYHFAEHYAERFGIECKVLVSLNDAREWLGLCQEAPATAGQGNTRAAAGDPSRS